MMLYPKNAFLIADIGHPCDIASVAYGLVDGINLFARAGSGFRAPSIQGRLLFSDAISEAKGESIFSVETGIKTQWLDNRARLERATAG